MLLCELEIQYQQMLIRREVLVQFHGIQVHFYAKV